MSDHSAEPDSFIWKDWWFPFPRSKYPAHWPVPTGYGIYVGPPGINRDKTIQSARAQLKMDN